MSKVAIVTDSNSGITQAQALQLGISVIPMPFMFGDDPKTYYEDINLTRDEFFERQESDVRIVTSQPGPTDVLKLWNRLLEEYTVCFGSTRNAMFRLKENWGFLHTRFEGVDKLWKKLRKTTDLNEYKSLTAEIFHTLPLR